MRLRVLLGGIALACSLGAADPGLVNLAIPGSQILAGVNVEQVMLSPFGQYLSALGADMPDAGLPKLLQTAGFDPRRDLREILVSANVAPNPSEAIFLARGTFDLPKIVDMARSSGAAIDTYKGVTVVQMSKQAAMAFPDSTLVISGDPAQVQNAIDRISAPAAISSAAALAVNQWSSTQDSWFVLTAPVSQLMPQAPGTGTAAAMYAVYSKVQQAAGGIKLGANAVTTLEVAMPANPDAAALARILKSLPALAQMANAKGEVPQAALLQSLNVTVDGAKVDLYLSVPEQQIEQMMLMSHKGAASRESSPSSKPEASGQKPEGPGTPEQPGPIRIGAQIQERKLAHRVEPVYPPLALQARVSGVVRMNAIIGRDGAVEKVTLASGHPLLATAAMEAVRQWTYAPTLLNGQPVEVATQIEVVFTVPQQ